MGYKSVCEKKRNNNRSMELTRFALMNVSDTFIVDQASISLPKAIDAQYKPTEENAPSHRRPDSRFVLKAVKDIKSTNEASISTFNKKCLHRSCSSSFCLARFAFSHKSIFAKKCLIGKRGDKQKTTQL
jgi:hypothetical protein